MHVAWDLAIASVDHSIRPEAGQELQYVEHLASRLGLPFFGKKVDVPGLAREVKQSLETVGRRERYRFFQELALREGYDRIALAHHLNDQGETLISHLTRGSGLRGLCGMAYKRPLSSSCSHIQVIRPLLDVTKAELIAYVDTLPILVQEDSSNQDLRYERNYIRHEIMPRLEGLNPKVYDALQHLSQHVQEDQMYLEGEANKQFEVLFSSREPNCLSCSRRAFRQEPLALQRRIWPRIFQYMGIEQSLTHAHQVQLHCLLQSGEPKRLHLFGVQVEAVCDTITIQFA